MDPSSTRESADATPAPARSVVGLMIGIAALVLGIVFVIALLDMRGGGAAPRPGGPAQSEQGGAKAAPPL